MEGKETGGEGGKKRGWEGMKGGREGSTEKQRGCKNTLKISGMVKARAFKVSSECYNGYIVTMED